MGLFGAGKKEIKQLQEHFDSNFKMLEEKHALEIKARQDGLVDLQRALQQSISLYPNYGSVKNAERYATTDDLYSIVSRISTTSALIPFYAYLVKDDKAAKDLSRLTQPHTMPLQTKAMMLKALEDLPENDALESLLRNPNPTMSGFEFFEALYTLLNLEGEVFIYKMKPDVGVNAGKPIEIYIMHPINVVLRVTSTLPRKVVGYDYVLEGQTVYQNMPLEDVIHIKRFNPYGYRAEEYLRGLSPVSVLKKRLTQNDGITDVSTSQMQNGGVKTIVAEEGDAMASGADGKEISVAGERRSQFYKFISNTANAGAPFFDTSGGKMQVLQLGSTLQDMQVIEAAKVNFKKLCNAHAVSDRLFNNDATGSEVSDDNARKGLYTDACLPNVYRVRDALRKGLLPDFKDKKREIREDISEIPVLQQDMVKMAQAMAALPVMIPGEVLRSFRLPVDESDENMTRVMIKSGYEFLDDLAMGVPDLTQGTDTGL